MTVLEIRTSRQLRRSYRRPPTPPDVAVANIILELHDEGWGERLHELMDAIECRRWSNRGDFGRANMARSGLHL